jgi:hypothetical protein
VNFKTLATDSGVKAVSPLSDGPPRLELKIFGENFKIFNHFFQPTKSVYYSISYRKLRNRACDFCYYQAKTLSTQSKTTLGKKKFSS